MVHAQSGGTFLPSHSHTDSVLNSHNWHFRLHAFVCMLNSHKWCFRSQALLLHVQAAAAAKRSISFDLRPYDSRRRKMLKNCWCMPDIVEGV
mmetsp:Transcript_96007/g.311447  ORF Transcript_96007/g.311447 Transcript_96007/m.311447 type:complete len:92 (+) Transcript_96007:472-747(+)